MLTSVVIYRFLPVINIYNTFMQVSWVISQSERRAVADYLYHLLFTVGDLMHHFCFLCILSSLVFSMFTSYSIFCNWETPFILCFCILFLLVECLWVFKPLLVQFIMFYITASVLNNFHFFFHLRCVTVFITLTRNWKQTSFNVALMA